MTEARSFARRALQVRTGGNCHAREERRQRRSAVVRNSLSGRRLNANERDERLQFKGDDDHLWRHLFAQEKCRSFFFFRAVGEPAADQSRNEG